MKLPTALLPINLLCASAFGAPPVDQPPKPDEWGYRPASGAKVEVNPPSLTWVASGAKILYSVQLADNSAFRDPIAVKGVRWPAYTHNTVLKPGTWYWRYQPESGPWSMARTFQLPADAVAFPQPTLNELKKRIPRDHPRLFARPEDRDKLRAMLGSDQGKRLLQQADRLLTATPTSEPAVKANSRDTATNQFWWSNRVQTLKALGEAELLTFVWWVTGDAKYAAPAKAFTLKLAAWDPDGPTNFKINCEAAKPMLHRLARAYDWGYGLFTEDERATIRKMLLRRAEDAWKSGEAREGWGHLNQPYGSHANRLWHKLAENAIATLGDTAESDLYLDYAVTKYFAAYPVWSDEDGGWHEGLSYFAGYMSKATWWFHIARNALGIDGFKKPFFRNFGDYPLYSAVPGSPNLGFGDLSSGRITGGWSFMDFFVRETGNPNWAWWLKAWNVKTESDDAVLAFLWSTRPAVAPQPPTRLPASKVFRGTGVAIMNTTLQDSAANVQVRFKSSQMGRWSHGHDPHNSFTLNAYGEPLIVNNVYRDLYGSPFHKDWVWTTRAQNAVLVDGLGQKAHTADPDGRIVSWKFEDTVDYVVGDATPAYSGKLTRALRHVLFVKPGLVLIVDELEADKPSKFSTMLHALSEFRLDGRRLDLQREKASVAIDYPPDDAVQLRQWTGYAPEPDHRYLKSINRGDMPPQWHVEASITDPRTRAFLITALRPYRNGNPPAGITFSRSGGQTLIKLGTAGVTLNAAGPRFATVQASGKTIHIDR
ncbi:MAG: DUF4962 domain-containing protein [Acidobacteria bacterium]|nr:DUF4962 domain-containing protein [Acidobacteriota bacterium]